MKKGMKKSICLCLFMVMLFLVACANSSNYKDVLAIQKNLLRPDTLSIRHAYSYEGKMTPGDRSGLDEKKVNFIGMHCTFENAGGTMTENYLVYDKDTGKTKAYDIGEVDSLSHTGKKDDPYMDLFAVYMYWACGGDKLKDTGFRLYCKDGVQEWSEKEIESINKKIK